MFPQLLVLYLPTYPYHLYTPLVNLSKPHKAVNWLWISSFLPVLKHCSNNFPLFSNINFYLSIRSILIIIQICTNFPSLQKETNKNLQRFFLLISFTSCYLHIHFLHFFKAKFFEILFFITVSFQTFICLIDFF